jgi:membrane-associated protease RseP (regulator of RpoE activity)
MVGFPEQFRNGEDRKMKQVFLRGLAIFGLLIAMPLEQAAAQRREPTVDERYRGPAPDELPGLNPPQTRQPSDTRELPTAVVGPAYFGVTFNSDDRDAVVRVVNPGSPAAQAGLQPSDVIESVQGRQVRSYQDVLDAIAQMRPGDMLNIEFSRRMNLRTQAALSSLPGASQRTVGYSPDSTIVHESLPVPNGDARVMSPSNTYKQPSRYTAPQSRNGPAYGQQRNYNNNKNNNRQNDNNRRILGLGSRRG